MPRYKPDLDITEKYRRRQMPVDVMQEIQGKIAPQENCDGSKAVADYYGNLKKFARNADPREEPSSVTGRKPKSR